jgi:hypothetical protein
MNRLAIFLGVTLSMCCPPPPPLQAQVGSPKSTPVVFFHETFNWKNTADPKGWTMPANVYLEDPNDTGLNWHWWPNDSLNSSWTNEPPLQSTTKEDGYLCLFGARYNDGVILPNLRGINNSIVFSGIDCSRHSSVILQFETSFRNFGYQGTAAGNWQNTVDISGDNGYHWTTFNASFRVRSSERPNNLDPGQPAIFCINITEVAAGRSNIMVRINSYSYFGLYFWIIDDMQLSEGYPNDLRLDFMDVQWWNKIPTTEESVSYMMPVSQLGKGHSFSLFNSTVSNMGAREATNLILSVNIRHGDAIVFEDSTIMRSMMPGYQDSLVLTHNFEPTEKGKYTIQYRWKQDAEDDNPEDNERSFDYYVSDSVYNRAGDQPDYSYNKASGQYYSDSWGLNANMNHFVGSAFPIYGDCEIQGIAAYITGGLADGMIDFGFTVWQADYYEITTGIIDPRFLLKTVKLVLDSTMFNTWVYLPFDKNGEDEFVKAGCILWAGIEYSNWHADEAVRRDKAISVGATRNLPSHRYRAVMGAPHNSTSYPISWSRRQEYNLMVRLYLTGPGSSYDPDIESGNTFVVKQNYPNPFTGQTAINYQIGTESPVRLEITDLTGRKVLVRDEGSQPAGRHQILIQGAGLAPGVYFYTIYAGANRETKRMMVAGL